MINATAIYVLWLRELKRFIRFKSRIIGTLAMPLFFLASLGFGFRTMTVPGMPEGVGYIQFLIPGILGMSMLFTSMFAGLSVLWDREFGFLKEIMVAPVSRVSIVLGRIAGGMTTSMMQGIVLLIISAIFGFRIPGIIELAITIIFMMLISATFIGLGLVFASRMKDPHGFGLVMNFVVFPMFFLSGALFPLDNLPVWLRYLTAIDPLTYGVDGIRGALIGVSRLPLIADFAIITAFALIMVILGAYLFDKSESA